MIIVGTCDASARPAIGRAVGARLDADADVIELVLSSWQWPGTAANLLATGRAAVTFARPSDYVSYQVKGSAGVSEADAQALSLAESYIQEIALVLGGLGLERKLVAPWLTYRDPILIRMVVDAVYVQTPGAKAGQPLTPQVGS
jgi:hypothetical protein